MKRWAVLLGCLGVVAWASAAQAGWTVGVRFGVPGHGPYCGPCYRAWYGPPVYYRPYPVYLAPAPVIVAPAQVVAVPARPAPSAASVVTLAQPEAVNGDQPDAPPTLPAPVPIARGVSNDLPALNDTNPQVRADAILAQGRARDRQSVAPITRALREDPSAVVRDAAARALGLIALPASLDALQRAAQSDPDRDVRKSASFAADVIRAHLAR